MVNKRPRRSSSKKQQQPKNPSIDTSKVQVPKLRKGGRPSRKGQQELQTPVPGSLKILENKENKENLLSLQSNQGLQSAIKPIPDFHDRFPNLAPDYELIARVDKEAKKLTQEAEQKLVGILNPVWEEDGCQENTRSLSLDLYLNENQNENQDLSEQAMNGTGTQQNKLSTIVEAQGVDQKPSQRKREPKKLTKTPQVNEERVTHSKQNENDTIKRKKRKNIDMDLSQQIDSFKEKKSKVDNLVVENEVSTTRGVSVSNKIIITKNNIINKKEDDLQDKLQQSQQQVVQLQKLLKEKNQEISALKVREASLKRELQVAKDEVKVVKTQKADQENNRQNNLRKAHQLMEMATELVNSIKYQRKG
eukprot:TRINITY_DN1614_c1_g1_i1.p1 TRINITY_DN1614_c1_g1~~TRINITY_DN1614_c1_g1_i1.p1  ORF type:complete len:363 (-),score=60.77 TRINITY_DN1614_c1_g1_i1:588-1676(-)